jgi:cyclase
MLKKRLVGVITVRNGWAVQSFGYRRYLPLGRAEVLAQNLDRWGADEILVSCIDRTSRGLGPDLELLRRIGSLGLATPVSYGGGIRNAADGGAVVQSGAERLCLDALLLRQPGEVRQISALVGAQAVIGVLPMSRQGHEVQAYDYLQGRDAPIPRATLDLFSEQVVSEALLIDWRNEGTANSFDLDLVRRCPLPTVPLIAFGGISEPAQLQQLFAEERVVAAGVGNFLAYREHAIQSLKQRMNLSSVRLAEFACKP